MTDRRAIPEASLVAGDRGPIYGADEPSVLVIADAGPARAAALSAVAAARLRLLACVALDAAAEQLAGQARTDLLLIELDGPGGGPELLDTVFAAVEAEAAAQGARVVVTTPLALLDRCAAAALAAGWQLLCEPSALDRVAALVVARPVPGTRLNDSACDGDAARLRRVNEEVARIAEALVRLTRDEMPRRGPAVRDHGTSYRGPDEQAPFEATAGEIRAAIRARRMRAQFFDGELFADPAWDMLLDLFAAELEGRRVSVSSLCIAAAVPPTTALRWIATMHEHDLFDRHADPADRRRAYIALSARAIDGMHGYVRAIRRAGLAIV